MVLHVVQHLLPTPRFHFLPKRLAGTTCRNAEWGGREHGLKHLFEWINCLQQFLQQNETVYNSLQHILAVFTYVGEKWARTRNFFWYKSLSELPGQGSNLRPSG